MEDSLMLKLGKNDDIQFLQVTSDDYSALDKVIS